MSAYALQESTVYCPYCGEAIAVLLNPEDVDTNAEDHLYDALRYGIMTRPRSSIWDFNPAKQNSGFQMSDSTFGY